MRKPGQASLAVVIPSYNEAATIRGIVERTLALLPRVIVVDDGSTDGTTAALDGLPVTLIRNPRNLGKAASLWRGIAVALAEDAEVVISLDGDGQHRPEDIPRLLAAHGGGGIVVGARLHDRAGFPIDRYLSNRFANFWIAWAAGQRIEDSQSGFRVYPASLLRALPPRLVRAASFVFESEILIEAGRRGLKLAFVPIPAIYEPHARRSHFRPVLDFVLITRMVAWKLISRGLYLRGLLRSLRGA